MLDLCAVVYAMAKATPIPTEARTEGTHVDYLIYDLRHRLRDSSLSACTSGRDVRLRTGHRGAGVAHDYAYLQGRADIDLSRPSCCGGGGGLGGGALHQNTRYACTCLALSMPVRGMAQVVDFAAPARNERGHPVAGIPSCRPAFRRTAVSGCAWLGVVRGERPIV